MNNTNEINTNQSGVLKFDPIVLVLDVARRWLLIILATLIVGIGTYIFTDYTYKPVYRTTTTFVVTTRGSNTTIFSNLTSTSSVAAVFSELLNSSMMRESILLELGTDSFDGSITAQVISETNLINVSVTASDPRTAYAAAKAIIDHHETITYRVVDGVSMEVLMDPVVPTSPINPVSASRQMRKMMLYAAVVCVAFIMFISYYQNKIRSGKEARSKLDCNYLGEIPHERKHRTLLSYFDRRKTSILINSPVTSFQFVETIRKLRRRVEQRIHNGKVLMVTSVLENEGKSTVAVNLALAMAQKREKVLLIDCDLRKPACYHLLEKNDFRHTVTDVITGRVKAEKAVVRFKREGLDLILENRNHNHSGDLISSQKMYELLLWARENYDFVVLDLPPMAEVSDAESMTKYADASLLVVRQNFAPTAAINKAVEALNKGKAKLLGCVLNNVYSTGLSAGNSYGSSRYRKYGHYAAYYGKQKTKS